MNQTNRHRKAIRWVLVAWAVYLVAGNLFVATPNGPQLIAPHPERFTIQWGSAWTVVPGLVHVRELEIGQHSKNIIWHLTIDRALTGVNLLALPFKTFHAVFPQAQGIEFTIDEAPTTMPPTNKTKPGFRIRLSGADVEDIRVLEFFGVRVEGESLRVGGGLDSTARGPLAVPKARIRFKQADITHHGVPLATNLELDGNAHIERHLKKDRVKDGILPLISGRLQASGDIADLGFIDGFVRSISWMQIRGGAGALAADLDLSKGTLKPGSLIEIETSDFTFEYLDYAVSGNGALVISGHGTDVVGDTLLALDLADFSLGFLDSPTPHIEGNDLKVTVVGTLAKMFHATAAVDVTIDIPESVVPDLRIYNRYFKEASPVEILSGEGSLRSRLQVATGTGTGGGTIDVTTNDVVVAIKGRTIVADLESRFPVTIDDLKDRKFSVDGSTISIANAGVGTPDETATGDTPGREWWCTIEIDDGTLKLAKPLEMDIDVTLTAFDAEPLFALMAKTRKSAERLDRILAIHELEGGASISLGKNGTQITGLHAEGGRAEVLGHLCLRENDKSGALYLKYGVLSLGVEIENDDEKKHLVGPRKWYEGYIKDLSCGPGGF